MTVINLENLEGIPIKYIDSLKKHEAIFRKCRFLEEILVHEEIGNLVNEIDCFCKENLIIGFHYTRAVTEDILKNGLTCRSGKEIRETFFKNHGANFTPHEIQYLNKKWEEYFDYHAIESRDNRIYFNFTTDAINEFGAQPLLRSYGGEQIYMPIPDESIVGKKLMQIGKPLILKCKLKPKNLNTCYNNSWGRIVTSSYHIKLNEDAFQEDQDGYQFTDVLPNDIEIIEFKGNLHFS